MISTWILVANKARAVVLTVSSVRERPTIVEVIDHPEGRLLESEMKSDRPGQSFDSRGVARHSLQPKESPSKHETRAFARSLAFMLDAAADTGKFDQLVLVCAHELLGELRNALHVQVSARVVLEVAKDIAKWSNPEIVAAVRKILDEEGQLDMHRH
jgi:protein required for attachment to host cells